MAARPLIHVIDDDLAMRDSLAFLLEANGYDVEAHARPVVLMTGHGDVNLAVEAMKAGAHEFIEKPFPDDVLLTAIGSALQVHSPAVPKEATRREAEFRLARLTSRELDVLAGLVAGRTNKVIGQDLGISPRTVEVYRANLMVKTGAQGVAELVRIALSAGF